MKITTISAGNIVGNKTKIRSNNEKTVDHFLDMKVKTVEKTEDELNLDYYSSLCKEYPEASFRLDDVRTAKKMNGYTLDTIGYNGSFHQEGSNFGAIGHCSIQIDIAVIEKMRTDPKYEMAAKWKISDSIARFGEYQTEVPEEPYTIVRLEDDNGRIQRSRWHSSSRIPTEEETKEMIKDYQGKAHKPDTEKMTDRLIDSYISMIEESERNRKEFMKHHKRGNDVQNSMINDARIMRRVSGEYSQSFVYENTLN